MSFRLEFWELMPIFSSSQQDRAYDAATFEKRMFSVAYVGSSKIQVWRAVNSFQAAIAERISP